MLLPLLMGWVVVPITVRVVPLVLEVNSLRLLTLNCWVRPRFLQPGGHFWWGLKTVQEGFSENQMFKYVSRRPVPGSIVVPRGPSSA
jgi:hypothetical protein